MRKWQGVREERGNALEAQRVFDGPKPIREMEKVMSSWAVVSARRRMDLSALAMRRREEGEEEEEERVVIHDQTWSILVSRYYTAILAVSVRSVHRLGVLLWD